MFRYVIAVLFSLFITACQLDVPSEIDSSRLVVPIADANLAAAINHQLGKAPADPIYFSETTILKKLEAADKNITNLSGLRYFTALTRLKLSTNQISDISELKNLTKLDTLDLSNNQISDIGAVGKLRKLKLLYLTNNRITLTDSLVNLKELTKLFLDYNKISLVTPLKNNCANGGMGTGDYINLSFNRLDSGSVAVDLDLIKNVYHVNVEHDELKK